MVYLPSVAFLLALSSGALTCALLTNYWTYIEVGQNSENYGLGMRCTYAHSGSTVIQKYTCLRLDGGDSHAYTAGATAFWILIGTIAAGAFGCTTAIYVDSGMFSHQMKVLVTCFWSLLHLGGAISAVVAYAVLFFTKDMFKEEIQGKKRMPSVSYYVVVVACAVAALAAAFTLLHMYAIKTAETVSPGKDARSSEMDDDE